MIWPRFQSGTGLERPFFAISRVPACALLAATSGSFLPDSSLPSPCTLIVKHYNKAILMQLCAAPFLGVCVCVILLLLTRRCSLSTLENRCTENHLSATALATPLQCLMEGVQINWGELKDALVPVLNCGGAECIGEQGQNRGHLGN